MKANKGIVIGALAGIGLLAAGSVQAGGALKVRNGDDLAAKIVMANSDTRIKMIKCIGHRGCDHKGVLPAYTGTQQLKIDGKGSTIDASGITDRDVISSTGGGRLKLMRLNIIGGMSGVYVEVPADKVDDQRVELVRVQVRDAALHGVYINDRNGAPAGVKLKVNSSAFIGNGLGDNDQDGLHVDETGLGRITARVLDSRFAENGSDGLELDEKGTGYVSLVLSRSDFLENGPNPVNPADPDDGLDIDESGPGDVWVMIHRSRFNGNFDDGIDLDERDAGSLYGLMERIEASNNLDQGVTFDERGIATSS